MDSKVSFTEHIDVMVGRALAMFGFVSYDLNGVVIGDCYSKGPRFQSRVSHGPFQKV
jgi:hypothetical protein